MKLSTLLGNCENQPTNQLTNRLMDRLGHNKFHFQCQVARPVESIQAELLSEHKSAKNYDFKFDK